MGFEIPKDSYAGSIKEISIGDKAVTVGGETCYPFYQFEGEMPHKPRVAMEVWDMEPEDWPEAVTAPLKDVLADPAAWAKKCVNEFGAEILVLQLRSTDPNGKDASADDAVATVKKVAAAVDVPIIIWGTTAVEKDEEVFKKIAEACQDVKLTLGPVEEKNHKGIGAAAMGYGHAVISSSPIDVNLAKQVNILLENLGMPMDRVLIDPTTGGLGYGMEYSYSVMERLRLAAMAQGDDKLQYPLVNNLGYEVWKCKEAKQTADDAPELGDPERRGVLMEAVAAVTYLMAGSDVLIMRHPESARMVRSFIDKLLAGGKVDDIDGVAKQLAAAEVDYAALAPKPDLTLKEEEKKKAAPKKAAAKKAAPKKATAKKAAPPKAAAKKAAPAAEEKAAAPAAEAAKTDPEAEAKAKAQAEADAKAKAEAEVRAKAEAEEKAKQEAEEKAKREAEEKARKAAEERKKRDEELEALRLERMKEREELAKKRQETRKSLIEVTPATEQKSELDKILESLSRVHKRV